MVTAGEYADLQQFYSHQMQLLDHGQTDEWSNTFTADGTFAVGEETMSGLSAIAEAAAAAAAGFEARGIIRRHWVGMLIADRTDTGVQARAYAVVIETPSPGGVPVISRSTIFEDHLVQRDGVWQVTDRRVCRDGVDA